MEISVRELKSRLSEYLRKVAAGQELRVTSRGRTVARLLPPRRSARAGAASGEAEALALLERQPGIRPGRRGRRRVGLAKPVRLRPGAKPVSETVGEMRD